LNFPFLNGGQGPSGIVAADCWRKKLAASLAFWRPHFALPFPHIQ
jgi:hypothetical protein